MPCMPSLRPATIPNCGPKSTASTSSCPDGQPVRWALNALHGAGLRDRVRGPELMLRVLPRRGRAEGAHLSLRQFRGSARAAGRQFEVAVPGTADCRFLRAALPAADGGGGSGRHPPDRCQRGGHCFRRPGIPKQDLFCRRHAGPFTGRAGQRGGGLRFSCRHEAHGAAVDASRGAWSGCIGSATSPAGFGGVISRPTRDSWSNSPSRSGGCASRDDDRLRPASPESAWLSPAARAPGPWPGCEEVHPVAVL